jgi:hypothetical protein
LFAALTVAQGMCSFSAIRRRALFLAAMRVARNFYREVTTVVGSCTSGSVLIQYEARAEPHVATINRASSRHRVRSVAARQHSRLIAQHDQPLGVVESCGPVQRAGGCKTVAPDKNALQGQRLRRVAKQLDAVFAVQVDIDLE